MFANIANTFANCFKIPELKSRILFTLLVLAICRVIANIPVPGLDPAPMLDFIKHQQAKGGGNNILMLYNMFTGGALQKCAIGALGIMPHITASIVMQMLTAMVPQLSKLAREEGGRVKIIQYSRYMTVLLCIIQGTMTAVTWENPATIAQGFSGSIVTYPESMRWFYFLQSILLLTTGTMLLMWLGEQITERGIGNGVSLVITIGILGDLPGASRAVISMFFGAGDESGYNLFVALALLCLMAGVVAGVVAVTQAQRKIPVQYTQRAVGRKVYAGSSSFMPLRVNYAGVMPVIFANAVLSFPSMIFSSLASNVNVKFWRETFTWLTALLYPGSTTYIVLMALMILFFSYFWVATQFNEIQIADDLKKYGGYIPGVRPGQATSQFLGSTMKRITLAGAIFLTVIAVIPVVLQSQMRMPPRVASFFGGTSMLILVGVLLDTMRQMETHLLMRHYDGFLKKGRIKGRF